MKGRYCFREYFASDFNVSYTIDRATVKPHAQGRGRCDAFGVTADLQKLLELKVVLRH